MGLFRTGFLFLLYPLPSLSNQGFSGVPMEPGLQACRGPSPVTPCPFPPDSDLCLKFAMLCTLNDKCDRLRKAYGEACSGPHCQRQVCLRQLLTFFEKAAEPHAQGLLLCPCAPNDRGCGERRRNTIAPSCALPPVAPNCLELRRLCFSDPLCRCVVWEDRVGRDVAHATPSWPCSCAEQGLTLPGNRGPTGCFTK